MLRDRNITVVLHDRSRKLMNVIVRAYTNTATMYDRDITVVLRGRNITDVHDMKCRLLALSQG
eukprot:1285893-Lingulodinium_polyedra.AAC.1